MAFLRRKVLLVVLIIFLVLISIYGILRFNQHKTFAVHAPVIEHLAYYATPQKDTFLQQALKELRHGKFIAFENGVLNKGIARDYYWVYFTVSNKGGSGKRLMLDIDNSRLNEIELFQLQGDSAQSLGKLGDFAPFNQRRFKDKSFLYYLYIEKDAEAEYFLWINQVGSTFVLPLELKDAASWQTNGYRYLLLDGIIYGILFFVALMSMLFYSTSGYTLYLYYSMYIFTGVAWLFSYFGLGYAYIWGQWPAVNTAMAPVTAALNIMLNLQICQVLLDLRPGSKFSRFFNACKWWLLPVALMPLVNLNNYDYAVNRNYLYILLGSILLAVLLVAYTLLRDAGRKSTAASVYLFAGLLKSTGIVILALLELGIIPATGNMEGLMQLGILIEISLLTYALAKRYSLYKLRTVAKVIEAHEKERVIISREIHDSISNGLTGLHYRVDDLISGEKDLSITGSATLEKLSNDLQKLHAEARNISHNIMPHYIRNHSLGEILERYIGEVQQKMDPAQQLSINFSCNDERYLFSEALKLNIFRIVQEALTNIVKHANASQADIVLHFTKHKLVLTVEDNGDGLLNGSSIKDGMGIKNIKARVELLQGDYNVTAHLARTPDVQEAAVQYGTRIQIKIPYGRETFKTHQKNEY